MLVKKPIIFEPYYADSNSMEFGTTPWCCVQVFSVNPSLTISVLRCNGEVYEERGMGRSLSRRIDQLLSL